MMRKQFEHVVEETNSGRNLVAAVPIDIEDRPNVGLFGWPMDARLPHGRTS
jgi:hypothetical protein